MALLYKMKKVYNFVLSALIGMCPCFLTSKKDLIGVAHKRMDLILVA